MDYTPLQRLRTQDSELRTPLQHLLIIRFSSAGDIILTSPFIRAVRTRYPDAEIHFLTKEMFTPLVKHSPYVNRVLSIGDDWGFGKLLKFKSELMKENDGDYDLVYDLHNSLRSRYFRFGLGNRTEVLQKPTWKKKLLVRWKINKLRPIIPIPERYLAVGKEQELINDGNGLDLFIGNTLPPVSPTEYPTIGFAPGARHATKRWLPEHFIELGNRLCREHGARILLFGSTQERGLCGEIAQGIDGETVNLAGRISWLESAAACDACNVVVTNDSAMMHIAAARKRPVVAIFGSTVQEFGFAPYGTRSIVVENLSLDCRPCSTIGREKCPKGHFKCMKDITVNEVLQQMNAIIELS